MKTVNIEILLNKDEETLLAEYVRRWNKYNEHRGAVADVTEEEALAVLAMKALKSPAERDSFKFDESEAENG